MAEDMSDLMKNLNSMLNGKELSNDIKEILENLSNSNNQQTTSNSSENSSNTIPPEMLNMFKNLLNSETKQDDKSNNTDNGFSLDFETILKLKNIMEKLNTNKEDPRANLLLSLKPYLKESRKHKVDQYIQFLKMEKMLEVLAPLGGELKK